MSMQTVPISSYEVQFFIKTKQNFLIFVQLLIMPLSLYILLSQYDVPQKHLEVVSTLNHPDLLT